MKNASILLFSIAVLGLSLGSCTSNLNYTATSPSTSVLSEIAKAAGVDAKELKMVVDRFVVRGGLVSLEGVTDPSQFPILACVADTHHDGTLNLFDVVQFATQLDKTCPQIAAEAASDPEMDNDIACPNLLRDADHKVDMEDVAVFALLYKEQPEFSSELCHNAETADYDQLSSYTESFAWLNTDPLDPDTYEIPDYDYYMNIIGGGGPECGNGEIEAGEECEEGLLNSQSCGDFGFDSGFLVCDQCTVDSSGCFNSTSGATRIAFQGFEGNDDESWKSEFTGRSHWEGHNARTTHDPFSGSQSLRWNQFGLPNRRIDPITGMPGQGWTLLDWRGGTNIVAQTPHEVFYRMRFRHDNYNSDSGYDASARKLFYVVDENYGVGGMYIKGQLGTMNLQLRYSNGNYSAAWAHNNWGYDSIYLSNPNVSHSLNGQWRTIEFYMNYDHHYVQIWVDGHLMLPSTGSNGTYWDLYSNDASAGRLLWDPNLNLHTKGFQIGHFDPPYDCVGCQDGAEYYAGFQIDDLEVWNGLPSGR